MNKPTQSVITVILPHLLAAQPRRPVYVRGVAVPPKVAAWLKSRFGQAATG